jgi:hypothetical protein
MTATVVRKDEAKQGVSGSTGKHNAFEIRFATVEVLVGGPYGDHPCGHAALRVNTPSAERVYDYGRYRRVWGIGGSEGEGVLQVWKDFRRYIVSENRLGRTTTGFVYEVPLAKAQAIISHFEGQVAGKKPIIQSPAFDSFVIDTYNALGPNCTTVTLDAAVMAVPNIEANWRKHQQGRGLNFSEKALSRAKGWPARIFMPADLQGMLEDGSPAFKSKNIYGGKR